MHNILEFCPVSEENFRMSCLYFPISAGMSFSMATETCDCQPCRHVSDLIDRCKCCVYHLHGKRSGTDTNYQAPRTRRLYSDTRNNRQYASYILKVLEPLDSERRNLSPIPLQPLDTGEKFMEHTDIQEGSPDILDIQRNYLYQIGNEHNYVDSFYNQLEPIVKK